MRASGYRDVLVLCIAGMLTACGGNSEPSGPTTGSAANIASASGNEQAGTVGLALPSPLVVQVTDANALPVKGATVIFTVMSGAASVSPDTVVTDSAGKAQTIVTLGSAPGVVQIRATVAGTGLSAVFTESAGTSTTSQACTNQSPVTLTAGQVMPGLTGTGVCISGGSTGSEFALVAFYENPDSAQTSISVASHGVTAVSTPNRVPASNALLAGAPRLRQPNRAQAAFDAHLRMVARQQLTPLMAAARAARLRARTNGAERNTIPAGPYTIGQVMTLNANGNDACDVPIYVGARVVAISNNAVVVADTMNPTGGFTAADYQAFATEFDTLINPLDTQNFGQPTDIDNNGKILIFFTKEVNKLTPKTGSQGYVGGFFFERDLFPVTSTADLPGCPTSNYGEMYYSLVPDPDAVYSIAHSKTDVLNVTGATLAHEYQHLINASRRLYVNDADSFEVVWLNEGLSHIAEELLFYRQSHFSPRQNLSASAFTDTTIVDVFNNDQADNFGRYQVFLSQPSISSPYSDNDSLQTRGATWNLLRYLADHRGTSDADTWSLLVNTTLTGQQNLANVFGSDYMTQIRDWATSVFSDDVPGVSDTRFLEPSWNMRDIFPHLQGDDGRPQGTFPLAIVPLSDVSPATINFISGGAAYIRFFVPANTSGSVDWTAATGGGVSPFMQFTLVRTQ